MISILDRYVIKELIGPFIYGILAFSLILAGSTVLFQLVDLAVKHQVPGIILAQIFVYKIPAIVAYTFPMSMLFATISAVGRLNGNSEIIALRAGGVSVQRVVVPLIVAGFFVSLMTIAFNEIIVPRGSHNAEVLIANWTTQAQQQVKKNINYTEYAENGDPVRLINVAQVSGNTLKNISIAEYDQGRLARLIRAKTGHWNPAGEWQFEDGVMHYFFPNEPRKLSVIQFGQENINLKLNPADLNSRDKSLEELNSRALKAQIEAKRRTGQDATHDEVNYHLKWSVPFASLIFAIIGASVGIRPVRTSSSIGLGMSLLIIFAYYILMAVGMSLGLSHTIPAILAAWIPNIVVGIVGVILIPRR